MNKKILIAAEIFPPAIGGPATYTVKIANALYKRGFKVRILCYGKPDKSVLNKSIKINYVWHKWPLVFKYFLYYKKLFWYSLGYKIIYAMGPVSSGLPAKCIKKLTGKKLIVKVVGDYAWEQAMNSGQTDLLIDEFQHKKFNGKTKMLQKIERKVCQSADKVITPSEYLKKIIMGWGIDDKKIKVIYNAFIVKQRNTETQKHNKNLIISIGRLVNWKGFDVMIKIMTDLLKHNSDFKLCICGQGHEKEKLDKLIVELKLEDKVIIQSLEHTKLLEKLSTAGLFVLNSGYEGLSHTILEAMAMSTPVITTNAGGNPELIQDGVNGILIEYNNQQQLKNAILKLHNNPELQQKFINNSKKVLEKFTFEKMVNETIEVLQNTL